MENLSEFVGRGKILIYNVQIWIAEYKIRNSGGGEYWEFGQSKCWIWPSRKYRRNPLSLQIKGGFKFRRNTIMYKIGILELCQQINFNLNESSL